MRDALRTRAGAATLASIILAGATLYVGDEHAPLAKSFDASVSDWSDPASMRGLAIPSCRRRPLVVCSVDECHVLEPVDPQPRDCVDRADDDHCYRELFRAQIAAWEANQSYEELRDVSPTGAAFVAPTIVHRAPGRY